MLRDFAGRWKGSIEGMHKEVLAQVAEPGCGREVLQVCLGAARGRGGGWLWRGQGGHAQGSSGTGGTAWLRAGGAAGLWGVVVVWEDWEGECCVLPAPPTSTVPSSGN